MNMTHTENSKNFKSTSSDWSKTAHLGHHHPDQKNRIVLHPRSLPPIPPNTFSPLQGVTRPPIFMICPIPFLYTLSTEICNCIYYSLVFKILDKKNGIDYIHLSLASLAWWTTAVSPPVLAWWWQNHSVYIWRCSSCLYITESSCFAGYRSPACHLLSFSLSTSLSSGLYFFCWVDSSQLQLILWYWRKLASFFLLLLRILKIPFASGFQNFYYNVP